MRRTLLAVLTAVLFAPAALRAADTYTVDPAHSEVAFRVRHLVSKVPGRFTQFEGRIQADARQPEASTVELVIKAASIDTANTDRDKHLRSPDFFDAERYPTIEFKSRKVTARGKDRYDVEGTLTMRGVSKVIVLPVAFLGSAKDPWGAERAGFALATSLNRKDYGVIWNKALDAGGLMLGDDVEITINIEAVKAAPASR